MLVGVEGADRRGAVECPALVVEPFEQAPPRAQPRRRDGPVGGDGLDDDPRPASGPGRSSAGRGPSPGTRATGRGAPCRCLASWSGRSAPRSGSRSDGRSWSSTAPMAGKSVGDGGKSPRDSVPGGWWRPVIAGSAAWTWLALGWVSERITAIWCMSRGRPGSSSLKHTPGTLVAIAPNSPRSGDGPLGFRVPGLLLRGPAVEVDHDDRAGPPEGRLGRLAADGAGSVAGPEQVGEATARPASRPDGSPRGGSDRGTKLGTSEAPLEGGMVGLQRGEGEVRIPEVRTIRGTGQLILDRRVI